MNNKGFTLVELLSVVIILSLIMILVVPNILGTGAETKDASYKTKIQNIESAAQMYGTDNPEYYNGKCIEIINNDGEYEVKENIEDPNNTDCYPYQKITIETLAANNYIKYDTNGNEVSNPKDSSKPLNDDYIYIYKRHNRVYAIHQSK